MTRRYCHFCVIGYRKGQHCQVCMTFYPPGS